MPNRAEQRLCSAALCPCSARQRIACAPPSPSTRCPRPARLLIAEAVPSYAIAGLRSALAGCCVSLPLPHCLCCAAALPLNAKPVQPSAAHSFALARHCVAAPLLLVAPQSRCGTKRCSSLPSRCWSLRCSAQAARYSSMPLRCKSLLRPCCVSPGIAVPKLCHASPLLLYAVPRLASATPRVSLPTHSTEPQRPSPER